MTEKFNFKHISDVTDLFCKPIAGGPISGQELLRQRGILQDSLDIITPGVYFVSGSCEYSVFHANTVDVTPGNSHWILLGDSFQESLDFLKRPKESVMIDLLKKREKYFNSFPPPRILPKRGYSIGSSHASESDSPCDEDDPIFISTNGEYCLNDGPFIYDAQGYIVDTCDGRGWMDRKARNYDFYDE